MMKRSILFFLISFISIGSTFSQGDKKAEDILSGVSKKLRSYPAIKAEFSYTLENPAEKVNETQVGTLHLKGKKYRLIFSGQEIICDSKTIWNYAKDSKEVNVSNVDPKEAALSPSDIFTMYEKGFKYAFIEEKVIANKTCQVIDLIPLDKNKSYFKVRLTVDKKAKQLVQSKIFDKNGNRYTYTVKTLTANPTVADAFFTFDTKKYPGVEVVDLR